MNYSSEEADKVFEVAKAIPVNRSIKAIPINISWFLFITLQLVFFFAEWRKRSGGAIAEQLEERAKSQDFRCKPRVAHRSPPRKFFGDCNLRTAIDFAERRMRS